MSVITGSTERPGHKRCLTSLFRGVSVQKEEVWLLHVQVAPRGGESAVCLCSPLLGAAFSSGCEGVRRWLKLPSVPHPSFWLSWGWVGAFPVSGSSGSHESCQPATTLC